jgi:hypothetical protein
MKKWVITLFLITSSIYLSNAQNLSLKQLYKIGSLKNIEKENLLKDLGYTFFGQTDEGANLYTSSVLTFISTNDNKYSFMYYSVKNIHSKLIKELENNNFTLSKVTTGTANNGKYIKFYVYVRGKVTIELYSNDVSGLQYYFCNFNVTLH